MKALVYTGPEAMEIRDVPAPVAGPGEAVVRVEKVGICGSDMHAYLGHDDRRPAPLTLGHEAAGVIIGGARDGQRVAVNPLCGCGVCPACLAGRPHLCATRQLLSMPPREGAFAEMVVAPEQNLLPIPDTMSFETAALAEPLAVCWHAAKLAFRVAEEPKARVLVIGGGPIGLGSALCLRAHPEGAEVVISEPQDARRAYVAGLGEEVTVPGDVPDAAFDIVIDAVGYAATREAACAAVRPGGVIVHIGLGSGADGVDVRRLTLQEIAFVGSYCYTPVDFAETVAAMAAGRLGALDWTELRPLEVGGEAFRALRAGEVAVPKIVLSPV